MKNIISFFILFALAFGWQACHNKAKEYKDILRDGLYSAAGVVDTEVSMSWKGLNYQLEYSKGVRQWE